MFVRAAIKSRSRSSLIYGEPFFIPPRYESRSRLSLSPLISQLGNNSDDFRFLALCNLSTKRGQAKMQDAFSQHFHSFIVHNNESERVVESCIGRRKRQKRGLVTHQLFFFALHGLRSNLCAIKFLVHTTPASLELASSSLQRALLGRGNRSE